MLYPLPPSFLSAFFLPFLPFNLYLKRDERERERKETFEGDFGRIFHSVSREEVEQRRRRRRRRRRRISENT